MRTKAEVLDVLFTGGKERLDSLGLVPESPRAAGGQCFPVRRLQVPKRSTPRDACRGLRRDGGVRKSLPPMKIEPLLRGNSMKGTRNRIDANQVMRCSKSAARPRQSLTRQSAVKVRPRCRRPRCRHSGASAGSSMRDYAGDVLAIGQAAYQKRLAGGASPRRCDPHRCRTFPRGGVVFLESLR